MKYKDYRFVPPLSSKIRATPQEAILAEWRRINLVEQEKARKPSTKSVSEIMPGVLQRVGLDRKRSELEILKVWNNLMDPVVAQHATPVGLAKGTLFINVDSNVWLDELVRYRSRDILLRLKNSFGPDLIQKLSFRVG